MQRETTSYLEYGGLTPFSTTSVQGLPVGLASCHRIFSIEDTFRSWSAMRFME